eukprot:1091396-Amphidinium_carterae.1
MACGKVCVHTVVGHLITPMAKLIGGSSKKVWKTHKKTRIAKLSKEPYASEHPRDTHTHTLSMTPVTAGKVLRLQARLACLVSK